MPCDIVLSNKTSGKERGRGDMRCLWCLSSQATITGAEVLFPKNSLDICLPMGSSESIPYSALLPHTAFVLLIKLTSSPPMSLSDFHLSSTHPTGEGSET